MPWIKVDTLALSLLRKILDPEPTTRLVLDQIVDHKWCNMLFQNSGTHFDFDDFFFLDMQFFNDFIWRREDISPTIACEIYSDSWSVSLYSECEADSVGDAVDVWNGDN